MSKEAIKDLVDLKLAFEVNEWEDFLLVLNEIRDRDKDIVAMYRKKYLEEKKSIQAYADECVEKNNEEWRKTLKDIGKLKQLEK